MANENYALVLTGTLVAGFDSNQAWTAAAAYFRMDEQRLRSELLTRTPVTIKESDDLAKLETLQAGAAAIGVQTEIVALDARPKLFALVDNTPRGPVPAAYVAEQVARGAWSPQLQVAEVGNNQWQPWSQLYPEVTPAATMLGGDLPSLPAMAVAPVADAYAATDAVMPDLVAQPLHLAPAMQHGAVLPPGAAIHAGFWRRVAALAADSILLGGAFVLVTATTIGSSQRSWTDLDFSDPDLMLESMGSMGSMLSLQLLFIVVGWLYGALFESSAMQATPGKRLMGLKVTDDYGNRIGFGRASGRHFGKIISGLIFYIGFMLAGWTARKQALHDMMAGCCVVFRNVDPAQPLPSVRPPMPWYGWLLNVLLIVAPIAISAVTVIGVIAAYSGYR